MSNKPIVTTHRYDTNYAKNPKKFRGRAGFVNNAAAAEVGNVIEEIVEDAVEVSEKVEEEINTSSEVVLSETDAVTDSTTTENAEASDGLTILDAEFEPAVVIETAEINEGGDDGDFSTISLDNTKKELIAHAETLGIEVKDWWGKKKILDAISSI